MTKLLPPIQEKLGLPLQVVQLQQLHPTAINMPAARVEAAQEDTSAANGSIATRDEEQSGSDLVKRVGGGGAPFANVISTDLMNAKLAKGVFEDAPPTSPNSRFSDEIKGKLIGGVFDDADELAQPGAKTPLAAMEVPADIAYRRAADYVRRYQYLINRNRRILRGDPRGEDREELSRLKQLKAIAMKELAKADPAKAQLMTSPQRAAAGAVSRPHQATEASPVQGQYSGSALPRQARFQVPDDVSREYAKLWNAELRNGRITQKKWSQMSPSERDEVKKRLVDQARLDAGTAGESRGVSGPGSSSSGPPPLINNVEATNSPKEAGNVSPQAREPRTTGSAFGSISA